MAIPAPVAKDHEIFKLLLCTYMMTFFSGMVDAVTWLSTVTATLPTHLTGTSVKIGIFFASNMIQELGGPMFAMVVSFFGGSLLAGVASRSPESKTIMTLSWCLLVRTNTPAASACDTDRTLLVTAPPPGVLVSAGAYKHPCCFLRLSLSPVSDRAAAC